MTLQFLYNWDDDFQSPLTHLYYNAKFDQWVLSDVRDLSGIFSIIVDMKFTYIGEF
jgi:hypothetical protein